MVPHVHITPMRASRALALRFLATKFGLGMDAFTVRAWRAAQGWRDVSWGVQQCFC